jgi:simple sugar transport system ATP-binding protein
VSEAGREDGRERDAIRVENISKRFGAVVALEDVSLHLKKGEVLGLIGDNGAGKSTLIKIMSGFHQPDSGRIFVNGEEVQIRSVAQARALGIDTVYQDLALVPGMSVYHNMFLRRELVQKVAGVTVPMLDNAEMRKRARKYLDDMGVRVPDVDAEVALLSGGQRQSIAVARSVYSAAKIILLDEPLAAMGAKEGTLILDLIRQLKSQGDVSMILIVHNYAHVFEVCDRVNLLQHGRIAFDKPTSETSIDEVTELVVREYREAAAAS